MLAKDARTTGDKNVAESKSNKINALLERDIWRNLQCDESVESSKTSSEFISKIVESASAENTGWNFIMGFACGKLIEGMNTAAVISAMKQNRHRTKDVLGMPVEPDDKTDAERLGYIG